MSVPAWIVLMLERRRNEANAMLHITGRDIHERTVQLYWSSTMGGWQRS